MNSGDIKIAFYIAYRTLLKSSRSTIALLVFILSLAFFNLIFVTGFLSGFSNGVLQSVVDADTSHIIILPQEEPKQKEYILNQDSVRKSIETIPGIVATLDQYVLSGSVAYDKEKNGTYKHVPAPIIGMDLADEKKVLTIHENMVQGVFPEDLKEDEILLGTDLSGGFDSSQVSNLGGAVVGDTVDITYANGIKRTYTVKGLFKITLGFISGSAIVSKKEAETILSAHDVASKILVKVDTEKSSLTSYVEKIKSIYPTFRVEEYTKQLAAIGVLVTAFDTISFIVSVISIIVAAVTIFIIIYINAVSRRRQIGILKAIGIRENIIIMSYVLQSIFYAVLGISGGLILLFLIVKPYLEFNPIVLPFGNAKLVYTNLGIIIDIVSVVVAVILAGFFPARIVTKEGILKAIWG